MSRNKKSPRQRCRLPSLAEFDAELQELARRDAARSRHGTSRRRGRERFTLEQVDFIISVRHQTAWRWAQIRDAFAHTWGRERTVASLQACYYRSNTHTPCRDTTGPLHLQGDAAKLSLLCSESLGLARRHPERLMQCGWFNRVTKRRARALGTIHWQSRGMTDLGREEKGSSQQDSRRGLMDMGPWEIAYQERRV